MYSNTQALPRPDINTFVIEAANIESLLVAPRIFGAYSSPTREGAYPKITTQLGDLLKAPDGNTLDDFTLRGKDGAYNEINRAHTSDSFVCVDRGLEERIDDAFARDAARFFDVEVITAQMILRQMRLAQEKRCCDTLFNAATFNATAAVVAYTEGNLATIDFPQDTLNAVDRLTGKGITPNTMVMNQAVWNRLRRSPKLQTYLYGNLPSGLQRMVTGADLASAFGVENVIIASVKRDTAPKGKTPTLSHIWGSNLIWMGNTASGDFSAGGAVRQIIWTGDAPDLFVTETYRNEARRGDMVRVRQFATEKVIDQTAGELITTNFA